MDLEAVLHERGDGGIGLKHDVAAMPAVAAVGAPAGNVGFTAEGHASRATVTRFDVNLYLVDKHVKHSLPAAVCTAFILIEQAPRPGIRTEGSRHGVL